MSHVSYVFMHFIIQIGNWKIKSLVKLIKSMRAAQPHAGNQNWTSNIRHFKYYNTLRSSSNIIWITHNVNEAEIFEYSRAA